MAGWAGLLSSWKACQAETSLGKYSASSTIINPEGEGTAGREIGIDHLLIFQYLMQHSEIDTPAAAHLCQRTEEEVRRVLGKMEGERDYLERGGAGRGTYWTLSRAVHKWLMAPGNFDSRQRVDWDASKTRVLSILMQRAKRGENRMTNAEIRQITMFTRHQVIRLMHELVAENPRVGLDLKGRYSIYSFVE